MSNHSNIKAINAANASLNQERIRKAGLIHMPSRNGRKLGGNRATKARRINGFLAMRTVHGRTLMDLNISAIGA